MDGQRCDKHPSAWAKARVILPSGGVLYACGHCSQTLDFGGEFFIQYEMTAI